MSGWQPENINITNPLDVNGNIEVAVQDQHTLALDLNFIQAQGAPTTLSAQADIEDTTLTLTDATGFVDGNIIALLSGTGFFYFGTQIGAAVGSVVTIDTPIDNTFISGTTVLRASKDMNVVGSLASPEIFQIGPVGVDIEVDITRVNGYIQSGTAMDDSLFGGLAALTNGVVFRKTNGTNQNFWNVKTNSDLAMLAGVDANYTDRAPAGSFGFRYRISYGGQDKHGVTIRLEANEILEILIQDDLSTLEVYSMIGQGHVVSP